MVSGRGTGGSSSPMRMAARDGGGRRSKAEEELRGELGEAPLGEMVAEVRRTWLSQEQRRWWSGVSGA